MRTVRAVGRLRGAHDQPLRRRHGGDATLRVVRHLRLRAIIVDTKARHSARGHDPRGKRRPRLDNSSTVVPADVLHPRVHTHAKARHDATNLRAGLRRDVLKQREIAIPIEDATEVPLRRREKAGIGRDTTALAAAVEEPGRVRRDRVGHRRDPTKHPRLLNRRRIETPDLRRIPVLVNRRL